MREPSPGAATQRASLYGYSYPKRKAGCILDRHGRRVDKDTSYCRPVKRHAQGCSEASSSARRKLRWSTAVLFALRQPVSWDAMHCSATWLNVSVPACCARSDYLTQVIIRGAGRGSSERFEIDIVSSPMKVGPSAIEGGIAPSNDCYRCGTDAQGND